VDPIFATVAVRFDANRRLPGETPTEFVRIATLEQCGISEVDRAFLAAALTLRAESAFA
jgi:hypothetical protein